MHNSKKGYISLTNNKDFYRLKQHGFKIRTSNFVICCAYNNLQYPRLGIIASKKIGNAVTRNRVKRIYRALFRNVIKKIPKKNIDTLIISYNNLKDYDFISFMLEFEEAYMKFIQLKDSEGQ